MRMKFHAPEDQCRHAGRYHTPTPRGYVEWHEDADRRMADGQRQEQCPTCGLWAVWMTADGRRANGSGP